MIRFDFAENRLIKCLILISSLHFTLPQNTLPRYCCHQYQIHKPLSRNQNHLTLCFGRLHTIIIWHKRSQTRATIILATSLNARSIKLVYLLSSLCVERNMCGCSFRSVSISCIGGKLSEKEVGYGCRTVGWPQYGHSWSLGGLV